MDNENSFLTHMEDLRRALLKCVLVTALLYPVSYFLSSFLIDDLVQWCFPKALGTLHFFTPTEVLLVRLRMALVLSLVFAYPWNVYQLWIFLLPGLYRNEQKMLGLWIVGASVLFFSGIAFCVWKILPLLMKFSLSFATPNLRPTIGLAGFLQLAGWLSFAFGVMFQFPVVVMVAVHFKLISVQRLRQKRPQVVVGILILSAVLTPPDAVSQILLAVPTLFLFELGLFLASRINKK